MVQVTVRWGGQFRSAETAVTECFLIDNHDLIGVLDELMNGQGRVVWLNDGVRDLGGWEDGERLHDSVWVFLTDLGDE